MDGCKAALIQWDVIVDQSTEAVDDCRVGNSTRCIGVAYIGVRKSWFKVNKKR